MSGTAFGATWGMASCLGQPCSFWSRCPSDLNQDWDKNWFDTIHTIYPSLACRTRAPMSNTILDKTVYPNNTPKL